MRFVADERRDGRVVRALRAAGHVVVYIADELASIKDQDVLEFAAGRNEVPVDRGQGFRRHRSQAQATPCGRDPIRMNELVPADRVARILMGDLVHEVPQNAFTAIARSG